MDLSKEEVTVDFKAPAETYTDIQEGKQAVIETNNTGFHRSFTPRQIHVRYYM